MVAIQDMEQIMEPARQLAAIGARLGDGAPSREIRIPTDTQFDEAGDDFFDAPAIEALADLLIASCKELEHLEEVRLAYAWKQKGGESQGGAIFGKCVKTAGLVRHYGKVEFVIWLAADHCREHGLNERRLEALTYHELLHAQVDSHGKPMVLGHDLEMFTSELERYGLWHEGLVRGKQAFDQIPLDLPAF
jgi:hypothetical protein